jgi:hypothetical protein
MDNTTSIYPPNRWTGKLCALVLTVILSFGIFHLWMRTLPPAQAYFLPAYAKATIAAAVHKKTVAIDKTVYLARPYAETIRLRVYSGRPLQRVILNPAGIMLGFLISAMSMGGMYDERQMARFRKGRRLRGPEMLTVRQYNKQSEGDGLAILLDK